MTAYVTYDASTALGKLAAEAVDQILEGKAKLDRALAAANALIWVESGPADMAALEAAFGIVPGQGQRFFDNCNAASAALADGRIGNLREIDQG
jgi:hypothetical protein